MHKDAMHWLHPGEISTMVAWLTMINHGNTIVEPWLTMVNFTVHALIMVNHRFVKCHLSSTMAEPTWLTLV